MIITAANDLFSIPFERMLIGKTDIRSFTAKNTSALPVFWSIDPLSFLNSPNISISPSSGTLAPGAAVTISVTFFANEPIIVNGTFSVKYSDVEGGINDVSRTTTNTFQILAEAYNIQAVTLTATGQEAGGDDIKFGLLRVGDYAHQEGNVFCFFLQPFNNRIVYDL